MIPGFTRRYGVRRLVHFEMFDTIDATIVRERPLKEWRRAWKVELIEQRNSHWDDLAVGSVSSHWPAATWILAFAGMTNKITGGM